MKAVSDILTNYTGDSKGVRVASPRGTSLSSMYIGNIFLENINSFVTSTLKTESSICLNYGTDTDFTIDKFVKLILFFTAVLFLEHYGKACRLPLQMLEILVTMLWHLLCLWNSKNLFLKLLIPKIALVMALPHNLGIMGQLSALQYHIEKHV